MRDQVQTLNYCAHAIEQFTSDERILRKVAPRAAAGHLRVIELLRGAVKFILPNCAELIDSRDVRQAHLDLLRLPFPCIALEAPWIKEDGIDELAGFEQAAATKRIALCWEEQRTGGLASLQPENRQPARGVFVLPIYWLPRSMRWVMGIGGTAVPYDATFERANPDRMLEASRIAHQGLADVGLLKKQNSFRATPFIVLPEPFEQVKMEQGVDRALAAVLLDSRDEVMALIGACTVLNCANVRTEDVLPSAALNKKRQAHGKQPFFTYKVLQLGDGQGAAAGMSPGGTHASPRMHLRRGHVRVLPDKRTVWVRNSMVNTGSTQGLVKKDYALS